MTIISDAQIESLLTFANFPDAEHDSGQTLRHVKSGMIFMRDLIGAKSEDAKYTCDKAILNGELNDSNKINRSSKKA